MKEEFEVSLRLCRDILLYCVELIEKSDIYYIME